MLNHDPMEGPTNLNLYQEKRKLEKSIERAEQELATKQKEMKSMEQMVSTYKSNPKFGNSKHFAGEIQNLRRCIADIEAALAAMKSNKAVVEERLEGLRSRSPMVSHTGTLIRGGNNGENGSSPMFVRDRTPRSSQSSGSLKSLSIGNYNYNLNFCQKYRLVFFLCRFFGSLLLVLYQFSSVYPEKEGLIHVCHITGSSSASGHPSNISPDSGGVYDVPEAASTTMDNDDNWDDHEFNDAPPPPPPPPPSNNSSNGFSKVPLCIALYPYPCQGEQLQESNIPMAEGEEFEVVEGDSDGWTRVRKRGTSGLCVGDEGYVPTSFLQMSR